MCFPKDLTCKTEGREAARRSLPAETGSPVSTETLCGRSPSAIALLTLLISHHIAIYFIVLFSSMKRPSLTLSPASRTMAQQASPEGHSQECPRARSRGLLPTTALPGPSLVPSPKQAPTLTSCQGPPACHTPTGGGPRPASPPGQDPAASGPPAEPPKALGLRVTRSPESGSWS